MCFEGTYWGHTPTTYAHVFPDDHCDKLGKTSTRGVCSCNTLWDANALLSQRPDNQHDTLGLTGQSRDVQ